MDQTNSYQHTGSLNSHKYLYIDKHGKVIIDAGKYQKVGGFSDGLALVLLANQGWGFIDKSGNVIIEPQFQNAQSFSEGLAGVEIGDKWGFIDKKGQVIIEPQYDVIHGFSEGIAVTVKGNTIFFIDKTGQTIFSRSDGKDCLHSIG